jgi:hypothetical protein
MRLRFVPPFVFFLLSLFMSVPGVHAAVAARPLLHVNCYNDHCDGVWPHDTDGTGGSNCVSGITDWYQVALKDRDGRTEGTLHLFESYVCDTQWATVYANTTYMTEVNIYTVRLHNIYPSAGDDDRTFGPLTAHWPNYVQNQWIDNAMAGEETPDGGIQDCIHAWVHWQDRYFTWHDTNTPAECL